MASKEVLSWDITTHKKRGKDEDYHIINFKVKGEEIPLKINNLRHLTADCDKSANYKGI